MAQKRPQTGQQEPQSQQGTQKPQKKRDRSPFYLFLFIAVVIVALCFVGGSFELAEPTPKRGILTERQDRVASGYMVMLKTPYGKLSGTWAIVTEEYINAAEVGDTVEVLQGVMRKVDEDK